MAKYFHEEIEEILDEPFSGHPSRKVEHDIQQIKKAIKFFARNFPVPRI